MKKLNEYLVLNYPAIWNSRIVYLLAFASITSIFFLLFGDVIDTHKYSDWLETGSKGYFYDKDRNNVGEPSYFLWGAFVIAWLYFQYHYKPFIRHYSLWETFKGSILNFLCVLLIVTPLYFLFTETVEGRSLIVLEDGVMILCYTCCLPIIFLPFIIKSYSFSEIMLIFIGLIFYSIFWIFVEQAFKFDFDNLFLIGAVHYLFILIYVVVKLTIRKYNKIDKWLIFLLVGIAPWFIAAIIEPVFRATSQKTYNPIPDTGFSQNPVMYLAAFFLSFFFLVFLTWYVTKSLKKPMVIN